MHKRNFSFTDNLSYYRPYNCGCGECTIQSILANACPTPLTDKLPIFSFNPAHKLAGKLDENEVWLLHSKTMDMVKKFRKTLHKTMVRLQANRVHVSEIVSAVRLYCEKPNTGAAFECDGDNYSKLLVFLRDKVSWFQHDVMSSIVNCLLEGNEEVAEVGELWRKYADELKKYAKNRVEEYEGVEFGLPPTDKHRILWMALDPGLDTKLSDIPALRKAFCEVFDCSNVVLFFYTARRSSVILEFVITLSAYKDIFPLSQDQIQQLAKLDVISLHIEDTDVFPQTAEWVSLMGGKDVTLCKSIYMHMQN